MNNTSTSSVLNFRSPTYTALSVTLPYPKQPGRAGLSKKKLYLLAVASRESQKITIKVNGLLRQFNQYRGVLRSFFMKHLRGVSKEDERYRNRAVVSVVRDYKLFPVLRCKLQNKWDWFCHVTYIKRQPEYVPMPILFPRERILSLALIFCTALTSVFPPAPAESMEMTEGMPFDLTTITSPVVAPKTIRPANWVSDQPNLKGSKAAVLGAYSYANEAGYIFAANRTERDQMVTNGTLVRLEGKYIRLIDVTEPYVLPMVARFVNRLGEQYAARGCGKLEVTGAMRNLNHQGTLSNGSSHSVHPTGMAIDLRRITPSNQTESFCLSWLEATLKEVEAQRRIDVTAENYPRHFHVVVVPHVYEAWLNKLQKGLDPEVKWLATALYFEAAFDEHGDGYRAIAAVIKNRVRSRQFPDTVLEVVAEGAAGRQAGGCQFSFMCDGRAENIQLLCGQHPDETRLYWQSRCENRWEAMVKAAEYLINTKEDPTGGAVLYYAASMGKAPYWARSDMKRGTIRTVGSHVLACSNYRGSDVCDKGGL